MECSGNVNVYVKEKVRIYKIIKRYLLNYLKMISDYMFTAVCKSLQQFKHSRTEREKSFFLFSFSLKQF